MLGLFDACSAGEGLLGALRAVDVFLIYVMFAC